MSHPSEAAPLTSEDQKAGFTLVEVLIALVIALLAISVLSGSVAASLRTARQTARWERAISRAQSHLDAIADPGRAMGEREGDEANGFHWRTNVSFVTSAPSPNPTRRNIWAGGTGLYAITVTISWHDGAEPQAYVLHSARLGPVPRNAP